MGSEVLSSDKEPQATRDKMVCLRLILLLSLLSLCLASQGRPGSCETSRCRHHSVTAAVYCLSGQNSRCCDYIGGGGGGSGWNPGNNNKPGSCPPYNGRRRRRSPEEAPRHHGGSGYNPGHHHNQGGCIRDTECPRSLKCCYLHGGSQCTTPQYWG